MQNTITARLVKLQTGMEPADFYRAAIKAGKSTRQIAEEIGVSHATVRNHLRSLGFKHIGGWRRAEAA